VAIGLGHIEALNMGRVRSLRIAGLAANAVDTDIIGSAGAVLHGIIVNVIDIAAGCAGNGGGPFEIRAYEDTTGTGATNLIWRCDYLYTALDADPNTTFDQSNHYEYSFPEGIWCKSGLRIEIDRLASDNLEVFVLYS